MPEVACDIARASFGGNWEVVHSRRVEYGLTNNNIFIHTLKRIDNRWEEVKLIVEKVTNKKQESDLFCKLGELQRCDQRYSVFPEVYGISSRGEEYSLYMEFIENVGKVPSLDRAVARGIASTVAAISKLFPELVDRVSEQQVLLRAERNIGRAFAGTPDQGYLEQEHYLGFRELGENFVRYPIVLCHNDLFWGNMGLGQGESGELWRLVDLGLVRPNVVGADLHHFARAGVFRDEAERFFRELIEECCIRLAVPKVILEFSSVYSAMARCGLRLDGCVKRGMATRVREEGDVFAILFTKASKLAGMLR